MGVAAHQVMTASGRDIYRATRLLIDPHSRDAPSSCRYARRELMDQGDMEGCAVWLRIKAAVEELLRTEAGGVVH